jgi:CHAD domain-containing protein
MLQKRYRSLRKAVDRLRVDVSAEARHALRGEVKKLRYALEAVGVIYGKPADAMLRSLRRLQERLGVQQDAAVAAQRLQTLAAAPPAGILPATVFLMGRLAEHHERSAARARGSEAGKRRRLRGRWKRLRNKFGGE